jgi:hypothetical protein
MLAGEQSRSSIRTAPSAPRAIVRPIMESPHVLGSTRIFRRSTTGSSRKSDRGCRYAREVYRADLSASDIVCSMSRVGDCWDNALAERCFATLKTEVIHRRPWSTKAEGVTRPSVKSARWTSRGNTLRLWQHSGTVHGSGSTPILRFLSAP